MPLKLQAQQDTIYYALNWKETIKDSAAFFRPPVRKEGNLFRVEDYFISGQLQMSGLSKTIDKTNWQGKVSWYNADGSLQQEGSYKNNKLDGKFISFQNKKKLVAIYKGGYFVEGSQNRAQGRNNYYAEIKNDTVVEIVYDNDIKGIRYENYSLRKGTQFLSKYYDEKGKLIGELNRENSFNKGKEVLYYYQPMRVRQVRYYSNNMMLGETVYYPKGNIRTKFELQPEYKKTFFSVDGTQLGSVVYRLENDYLKAEDGSEYFFSYGYLDEKPDVVTKIKIYQAGKLQKEQLLYSNGAVKSVATYKDNKKELQISYNEQGDEIARMVYEGYYPFSGTEINGNKTVTYANGELVTEINYYPKTKLIFNKKTKEKEIYYDIEGRVIGSLEVKYENKYVKPLNGKRFYVGYDKDISSKETYKDGFVTERTTYSTKFMSESEKVDFKHTEYFKEASYDRAREVNYYSNGSKQSDISYIGYEKVLGKFYNDKDELLGTYDYEKKDGTLYEFFNNSNVIRLFKEQANGNLVRLKKYDYGNYRKYGDIDAVLIKDIDITCCSKSYKKNGNVFAEATYKDGKIWEGTVYDANEKNKTTVKEGKRHGVYKIYDYNLEDVLEEGFYINDKKEGLVKKYTHRGALKSIENYENDELEGETIYYNEDGKKISRLIYKKGKPFEGTKNILSGYGMKPVAETYKNGTLMQRVSYNESGKSVSKYLDKKVIKTIAYHKDSDKKRLSYTVEGYYIDGEVVRYNKNGKEQHRAFFKNNRLESGVVFITSRDTYDKRVAYIILNKQKNKITVTMKSDDDKVVFFAEENLEEGYSSKYIKKLNLYIDNLTPESLY